MCLSVEVYVCVCTCVWGRRDTCIHVFVEARAPGVVPQGLFIYFSGTVSLWDLGITGQMRLAGIKTQASVCLCLPRVSLQVQPRCLVFQRMFWRWKSGLEACSDRAHQLSCCPVPPNPQCLSSLQCQFSGQAIGAYRLILQPPSAVTKFSNSGFLPSPYPPRSAWLTVREKDRGTPVKEEYEQPGITRSPLRSSHPAFISTGCLSLTSMTVLLHAALLQTVRLGTENIGVRLQETFEPEGWWRRRLSFPTAS